MNTLDNIPCFDSDVFARRVKVARVCSGMTQIALANKTGIAANQIWGYENPRSKNQSHNPTIRNVFVIASVLDVSIDWLCGIDNPNNPNI